ncbi:MAG TPA: hypothetical protein VNT81_08665 [Vicinamibacterales bacterium]|nr:hypothetical protein [Vicinamibacterales bacterium]
MTAPRLLRLYPRAWRDRYGDEFLDTVGQEPLQLQQVIDIVSGAIDAWLSADVRGTTRASAASTGGVTMVKSVSVCEKNQTRYTKRDGVVGAGVMLAGTVLFVLLAAFLKRNGWSAAAEAILVNGYLVAMMLSMPFWLTKGQPVKSQIAMIGIPTALLVLIAWINA